ncbi:MAG TPA: hypothetical protein VGO69_01850 [Pyrinomonadaceae bacterium]|jgi:hypothetical protein|nr:hypothetical protein [Pyrinomonadaceae bacterium]
MMKKAFLCSLLCLITPAFIFPASAQNQTATQAPAGQQTGKQQTATEDADLSITANVTARELRFEVVPNPAVEFSGKPERETVWDAERENLPRPVQPNVTYRNIGIRLKITSIFPDIDRIVAEALGEVPPTDDAPPDNKRDAPAPQQPSPPSQPATQPQEGRP